MNIKTAINEAKILARLQQRAIDVIQEGPHYVTIACCDNMQHWPIVTVLSTGKVISNAAQ